MARAYACAECGGPITTKDAAQGQLMTINVEGHGKAAHRVCPTKPEEQAHGN